MFDNPPCPTCNPDTNVSTPAHTAVARTLAAASTVLLKNEGALPLPSNLTSIAVIGNRCSLATLSYGGGSGQMYPAYVVTPLQGIQARAGPTVNITYTPVTAVFSQYWSPERGDHYLDFQCLYCYGIYNTVGAVAMGWCLSRWRVVCKVCGTAANMLHGNTPLFSLFLPPQDVPLLVALTLMWALNTNLPFPPPLHHTTTMQQLRTEGYAFDAPWTGIVSGGMEGLVELVLMYDPSTSSNLITIAGFPIPPGYEYIRPWGWAYPLSSNVPNTAVSPCACCLH